MCRVLGIIEATGEGPRKVWSLNLQESKRRAVKLSLVVELLDPVGAPTEAGSQRYSSSGWQLPKLSTKLVLSRAELMRMDGIEIDGQFMMRFCVWKTYFTCTARIAEG